MPAGELEENISHKLSWEKFAPRTAERTIRTIENIHVLAPVRLGLDRCCCGRAAEAYVKVHDHGAEEAKHHDLKREPGEYDLLSNRPGCLGRQAAAGALDVQGDNVSPYKEFCQPCGPDDGEVPGVDAPDNATEGHIDRGGEEGRREEDEETLHDVEG